MIIQIPKQVIDHLKRMEELNVLLMHTEEREEERWAEYRRLQEEAIETFGELVRLLVKAGLLSACVESEELAEMDKSDLKGSIHWEISDVFVNGNLWLYSDFIFGSTPRPIRGDEAQAEKGGQS